MITLHFRLELLLKLLTSLPQLKPVLLDVLPAVRLFEAFPLVHEIVRPPLEKLSQKLRSLLLSKEKVFHLGVHLIAGDVHLISLKVTLLLQFDYLIPDCLDFLAHQGLLALAGDSSIVFFLDFVENLLAMVVCSDLVLAHDSRYIEVFHAYVAGVGGVMDKPGKLVEGVEILA